MPGIRDMSELERLASQLESYAASYDKLHRDIADDFRKAAEIVRQSATLPTAQPADVDLPSLRCFLSNVAQLIDTIKVEWTACGAWSEWDQSVRDDLTRHLQALHAALASKDQRP
jgi:hypothetical protein